MPGNILMDREKPVLLATCKPQLCSLTQQPDVITATSKRPVHLMALCQCRQKSLLVHTTRFS